MPEKQDDADAGRPRGVPPQEIRRTETPSSWRLTFTYDDTGIQLYQRQRVAMLAPPDDSARTLNARAGSWLELRRGDGRGLYRQVLVDPVPHTYEAHTPLAGRQPSRVPAPPGAAGLFQAVVPDLADAQDVVLHGLSGDDPLAVELLVAPLRPEED